MFNFGVSSRRVLSRVMLSCNRAANQVRPLPNRQVGSGGLGGLIKQKGRLHFPTSVYVDYFFVRRYLTSNSPSLRLVLIFYYYLFPRHSWPLELWGRRMGPSWHRGCRGVQKFCLPRTTYTLEGRVPTPGPHGCKSRLYSSFRTIYSPFPYKLGDLV